MNTAWDLPPTDLLSRSLRAEIRADDAKDLLAALARLGAPSTLHSTHVAPQAIRYNLLPTTRMKTFRGLEPDLMIALEAESVRIDAPAAGTNMVSIELPRSDRATVALGDVVEHSSAPLRAAIGVDMMGEPVVLDIAAAPHVLVAGRTGGGKSVTLHAILAALLSVHTPDTLEILLVDPKRTEMSAWSDAPHVSCTAYDPMDAIDLLWAMVESMEATYRVLQEYRARSLDELNVMLERDGEARIPHRLLVCDETADLVMTARGRVESAMVRLGQKGRAAGFHAILSTQSPRATVITGLLKANLPARIALSTSNALDSRIILDRSGAESLLGRGDMLVDDGISGVLRRGQAAFVSSEEIDRLVGHWRTQVSARELVAA